MCKKGQFDISKIPDIYDAIKYDLLHNHHLQLAGAQALYVLAKALADDVIPSEYGVTPKQKFRIGSCITHKLLVCVARKCLTPRSVRASPDGSVARRTHTPPRAQRHDARVALTLARLGV